ncbi:hypothetical protein EE612_025626 [Oryza sativa]|nr:hypothetical protein EE612_025626 [Oryza sativa]
MDAYVLHTCFYLLVGPDAGACGSRPRRSRRRRRRAAPLRRRSDRASDLFQIALPFTAATTTSTLSISDLSFFVSSASPTWRIHSSSLSASRFSRMVSASHPIPPSSKPASTSSIRRGSRQNRTEAVPRSIGDRQWRDRVSTTRGWGKRTSR